jgi:hypothetical protein
MGRAHISRGVGDGNMARVKGAWNRSKTGLVNKGNRGRGTAVERNWSCSGGEKECAYSSLTLERC